MDAITAIEGIAGNSSGAEDTIVVIYLLMDILDGFNSTVAADRDQFIKVLQTSKKYCF